MTEQDLIERRSRLRMMIPKTRSGDPKTDRLEKLDSLLYSRKFSDQDLDFIEKEILSAVEFFERRKQEPEEDAEP